MSRLSRRVLNEAGGGSKIWGQVTQLAQSPGIIADLGQGFPDFLGSEIARNAAADTIRSNARMNQYSLVPGLADLRQETSKYYAKLYPDAPTLHPDKEVLITTSATEALYATMQAVIDPGDEVICFQPFFPWYPPCIRFAGGVAKVLDLTLPHFEFDMKTLEKAVTEKTKVLMINTPHNPTGHVATAEELNFIADLCIKNDILVVSDEVYENYVFNGSKHLRICDIPGMRDRTVVIGSFSKMLSVTGWRMGYCHGPEDIISAVRTCHSYVTYCAPTPLQVGVAAALKDPDQIKRTSSELSSLFADNSKRLAAAVEKLGCKPILPQGGYFLVFDVASTQKNDLEFCEWMAHEKGVIGVPMSVFYTQSENQNPQTAPNTLVRFSICKTRETIDKAINALQS